MRRDARRGGSAAPPPAVRPSSGGYHTWVTTTVEADGREIVVLSKPGVPGHGALDPARGLLLDHVELGEGESLLELHSGAGVVGALAAASAPAAPVLMCDRNLLAMEAARRTLAANGIQGPELCFGSAPPPGDGRSFDVAVVRLPIGRIPTLHQLWTAFHHLRPGGRCYLAGANDEGIRTALRQMGDIFGEVEVLGYRGGNRVGVATRPGEAPESAREHEIPWVEEDRFHTFAVDTPGGTLEISSRPGVFSWDRLDAGSRALLDTMVIEPGDSVLELGCGHGVVGMAAARVSETGEAVLVDVDAEAVRSAARGVEANGLAHRVQVLASDGTAALPERRFNVVVTNPPFHLEKETNLDIPAEFIQDAARALLPGGRLYLVANRTLPYERWLQQAFGSYELARDGREFKVLSALARPLQQGGKA